MRKKRNYWNKETAFSKALEFKNKRDFKKRYIAAYELLRKNDWLCEACLHMERPKNIKLKWTYDKCKNEVKKYKNINNFRKDFKYVYKVIKDNNWFIDICGHMESYKKPIFWTKEKCQEEANKYEYRIDFNNGSMNAYAACVRNSWLDDVCQHMYKSYIKSFKWSKEKCQYIALKYEHRKEFQVNNKNAYSAARYNGWLDEICSHMNFKKLPNKYWHSFDNCKNEALKYNNKRDFVKNSQHVYNIVLKMDWLDEICSHMKPLGDKYNRCIYSYEFSDMYVYVGLTYNFNMRKKNRKRDLNDAVTIHIKETKLKPKIKQLTNYVNVDEAIILEKFYLNKYISEGWKQLNRRKTGGLGGSKFKSI